MSGINFIGRAGEFEDDRMGANVEDVGAESIGDIKDGIAVGVVSVDFEECEATSDGVRRVEALNGENDRGFFNLSDDKVGAAKVGVENDSNARNGGVVGSTDGKGVDIEIASREEGRDTS